MCSFLNNHIEYRLFCIFVMFFSPLFIVMADNNFTYNSEATEAPQGTMYDADGVPLSLIQVSGNSFIYDGDIVKIGAYAFHNCSGLKSVSLPESVRSIGYNAFSNCTDIEEPVLNSEFFVRLPIALTGNYSIPEGISTISSSAFRKCDICNVILPSSLETIEKSAFAYCSNIESFILPQKLSSIEDCAFWYCSSLDSIAFGSIPYVGRNVFVENPSECKYSLAISDESYVYSDKNDNFPGLTSPATYTRTMTNYWETCVLPFNISVDGSEVYELYDATTVGGIKTCIEGRIEAGKPFLIHLKDNQTLPCPITIRAYDNTLNTLLATSSTSLNNLDLAGAYTLTDLSDIDGYVLENDAFVKIDKSANPTIEPFHAYISGSSEIDRIPLSFVEGVDYVADDGSIKTATCQVIDQQSILRISFKDGESYHLPFGWYAVSGDITLDGNLIINEEEKGTTHLILTDGCRLVADGTNIHSYGALNIYVQADNTGCIELVNSNDNAVVLSGATHIFGGNIKGQIAVQETGSLTIESGTFMSAMADKYAINAKAPVILNGGLFVGYSSDNMNHNAALGFSSNFANPFSLGTDRICLSEGNKVDLSYQTKENFYESSLGEFMVVSKYDHNADGKVSVSDLTRLIQIVSNNASNARADVNNDGAVDEADIDRQRDKILGKP